MKERLTNNIVLKIVSVIFAIIIWLIVLNINDPDKEVTITGIPVRIVNDEAITSLNKAYTVEAGETCKVSIAGPRSIVDQLDSGDFIATADVNDLSLTNSVPINVELENSSYKSKVDITVETILRLEIEDIIEKEFEIVVKYVGEEMDGYVATETKLDAATVIVSAPYSQMERIKTAVTTVSVGNKSDDFEATTDIRLLDYEGKTISINGKNMNMSIDKVDSVTTVLYKKDVDIECTIPEFIDENNIISKYELSEENITILGRKNILDGIGSIVLPVDLEGVEVVEDILTFEYELDALLPEDVINGTQLDKIVLNIFIEKHSELTFTKKVNSISIGDIPDDMEASLVSKGNIVFTVRGLKDLIDNLSEEDIELKVEVGELGEGTHSLLIQFAVPEGIEVIGNKYVDVSLALKEEESSSTEEPSEQESTTDGVSSDTSASEEETDNTEPSEDETTSSMVSAE